MNERTDKELYFESQELIRQGKVKEADKLLAFIASRHKVIDKVIGNVSISNVPTQRKSLFGFYE